MTLRQYAGGASAQTLTAPVTSVALTATISDNHNWPDGSVGPFTVVVDRGTTSEEKWLCASQAANTITITSRAYDGTAAYTHSSGAVIEHCGTAQDFIEANAHVNATSGVHGVSTNVVGLQDTQTLTNKSLVTPTIVGFDNANHDHTTATQGGTLTAYLTATGAATLTNKTLTQPVIADFTLAGHTHQNVVQGGQITPVAVSSAPSYAGTFANNGSGFAPLSATISATKEIRVVGQAKNTALWSGAPNVLTGLPVPASGAIEVYVGWNLTQATPIRYNLTAAGALQIVNNGAANDVISFNFTYQS